MGNIQVLISNKQEYLLEKLCDFITPPLKHPFTQEIIVVQTRGMQEWLRLKLAETFNICANASFPYVRVLVWNLFQKIIANVPKEPSLSIENMTWALMSLLEEYQNQQHFEQVQWYLSEDESSFKRMQLAQKLAQIFDHYTIYRSDLIDRWDQGADPHDWQAILWRRLVQDYGQNHRTYLQRLFVQTLNQGNFDKNKLPERISFFGVSNMPPFYLEVFQALSQHTQIHFFVVSPNGKEKSTLPILLSGEQLIKEFLGLLRPGNTHFEENSIDTLLAALQRSMWENKATPHPQDHTVQIHNFHSPLRELEYLKDYLLGLFQNNPGLKSRDVLILAPDIQPYIPLIDAVFGDQMIPYRVAEKTLTQQSPVYKAFNDLLDLADSRFTLSEVLNVLEQPIIHQAFGFKEDQIGQCQIWLDQVQVRWGIDREHRQDLDIIPFAENTWKQGLERMLMGYAIPGNGQQLIHNILPFDDIEGSSAQTLGCLLDFTDHIFQHLRYFRKQLTLSQWAEKLREIPEHFLKPETAHKKDLNQLFQLLDKLAAHETHYQQPVSLAVVRSYLGRFLSQNVHFTGFTGQVMFSSLIPMRGIPAKVICVLGLNNLTFPEKNEEIDFNHINGDHRPGDDDARVYDRYLFIEALLAAREYLYISYQGQSLKDNSKTPPSIVVSELVDTLEQITGATEKELILPHPLHPFDAFYFNTDKPTSFNPVAHAIYQSLAQEKPTDYSFGGGLIYIPKQETIAIQDLVTFFKNPCKWYITKCLQMILKGDEELLPETEIFELDSLERYQLDQELLGVLIEQGDLAHFKKLKKAENALQVGFIGDYHLGIEHQHAQHFWGELINQCEPEPQTKNLNLSLKNGHLIGKLNNLQTNGRVGWRFASIKPKDKIEHWIYHLALCGETVSRVAKKTHIYGYNTSKDKKPAERIESCHFIEVTNPQETLETLLEIYHQGQQEPLPFFPACSYAWVTGKTPEDALKKAENAWSNVIQGVTIGDGTDPYNQRCYSNSDRFNAKFRELAETVFKPLLAMEKKHE